MTIRSESFALARQDAPAAPTGAQTAAASAMTWRHHTSLSEINPESWDRLFPGRAEAWDYFRAIETTKKNEFTYSAIAVYAGDDLIAAAPAFGLNYRYDTALADTYKTTRDWIDRTMPWALRVPILGLGSPMTEECPVGFAPNLSADARGEALETLLSGLHTTAAAASKRMIIALKDITDQDAQWMHKSLTPHGYTRIASLPVATLPLPYKTIDEYLATLHTKVRSELRRKMRQAKDVEIEFRDNIDDIHDEIIRLYAQTRANRKASYDAFDEVPEDYFMRTIGSNPQARVMLCKVDGRIASFNLFLQEEHRIIGKFIGLNYEISRKHNIYFVNWMRMIQYCLDNGISELQTGQTSYQLKVRLGCKLKKSWIYFRHTIGLVNPLIGAIGARMDLDQGDPDLIALGNNAPYISPAN